MIKRNNKGYRIGEGHHRAKLSDEAVREMRATYADWKAKGSRKGCGTLGLIFGCSERTAYDIVTYATRYDV